jgi:outer membrane protein TolC
MSRSLYPFAIHVALVLLVLAPSRPLSAAPAGRASEVDALVQRALDHAPALAAQRARAASAREQVEPAGALPDPMVGAMYQSIGRPWAPEPMSMAQVEFSQAFPGVGKRAARRSAARAQAAATQAELAVVRAELARAVRVTYASVYSIDGRRQALETAKQLVKVLLAAVSGRYTSGQLDQEALFKMQLEQSGLDEQATDLAAARVALLATLNQLTARPETATLARVSALPDTTVDTRALITRVLKNSPELKALRAEITAASQRVGAAESESRPNWFLALAGGATTGGEPVFTVRAGTELPLWSSSKQGPLVRAAGKDVDAARADLDAAELRLREIVQRLAAQWQRDVEQVKRYRGVIVPQAALALDAARAGYATGRTDFSTVIDDFRRWIDAQLGLVQREADKYATWAELQALLDASAPVQGRAP